MDNQIEFCDGELETKKTLFGEKVKTVDGIGTVTEHDGLDEVLVCFKDGNSYWYQAKEVEIYVD